MIVTRAAMLALALLALGPSASVRGGEPAAPPEKKLPLPGEVFTVGGNTAFLIPSPQAAKGKPVPWIWYAPTLPGLPAERERWMFERVDFVIAHKGGS